MDRKEQVMVLLQPAGIFAGGAVPACGNRMECRNVPSR